jgi:hypothetical protein
LFLETVDAALLQRVVHVGYAPDLTDCKRLANPS